VLDGVLEIAAYCSMVVAMSLLIIKLFWPRVAPKVHMRRFRRRLGKVDNVIAAWTDEIRAQDESKRREQRHPETTDD
jgi:hypothetical protein